MMNNRTTQADVSVLLSSCPGRERYWVGNLVTSCFLAGAMVVIQMMGGVPGATAATSTTVNLSTTVNVATCEFTLSNARPALKSVDASAIAPSKTVELGYVTLTLANCSGSLAGSGKALKVNFAGSTLQSLGVGGSAGEYLFRDAAGPAVTSGNVGFVLTWNATTSPWGRNPPGGKYISDTARTFEWPGTKNSSNLGGMVGQGVNVAYSLSPGQHAVSTVKSGTVKSTLTITLSIA